MRLFLIGYMGSGKSNFARVLSVKLGLRKLDTDRLVEEAEGMTIPEIFREKGEIYFREAESRCIDSLSRMDDIIVATGGGLPCFNDNMQKLKELGITVYLKVDPSELVRRLERSRQERPLIKGKDHEALTKFVEENLTLREEQYRTADITYDANSNYADGLISIIEYIRMSDN